MKALTVQEPYASALRCGYKKIETRSWKTNYRGPLLIHSGKSMYKFNSQKEENDLWNYIYKKGDDKYRCGVVHCKVNLVDCILMTNEWIEELKRTNPVEYATGFYSPGRYAWVMEVVETYDIDSQPVISGKLGLWNI